MIFYAVMFGFSFLGLAFALNLWRLLRGPTVGVRIVGLDTMVINAIALIVLAGIASNNAVSFEAALLLAMVGFIGTVAYCKFQLRGDIIE